MPSKIQAKHFKLNTMILTSFVHFFQNRLYSRLCGLGAATLRPARVLLRKTQKTSATFPASGNTTRRQAAGAMGNADNNFILPSHPSAYRVVLPYKLHVNGFFRHRPRGKGKFFSESNRFLHRISIFSDFARFVGVTDKQIGEITHIDRV